MKKKIIVGLCLVASSFLSAEDIDSGKAKSVMCMGCHGANGISIASIYPNLAGQKSDYLVSALKGYKSQDRKGGQSAIMYGMVAALTDDDVLNLAAYYSSLDPTGQ